jgi:hypothetical protein
VPNADASYHFAGFRSPRYTPTPDELFDELLAPGVLTEAELRVLLYIVRRTFGFKKDADAISLSQLTDGIIKTDGIRLDWGAGVKRAAASRAVQSLERKGIIHGTRTRSRARGNETTVYSLVMADDPKETRVVSQRDQGRLSNAPALESQSNPQETDQETDKQEDGPDPNLLAAIRTLCYQRRWPLTEARAQALATQAGTLARWQEASAGAGSLAEVVARLEG